MNTIPKRDIDPDRHVVVDREIFEGLIEAARGALQVLLGNSENKGLAIITLNQAIARASK